MKYEIENYEVYLESIADYLPKKFYKYYNEPYSETRHNRFHDCGIKEIKFSGDSFFYKSSDDTIKLVLNLGDVIEYVIDISDIISINVDYHMDKDLLSERGLNVIGEILDCFVKLLADNKYGFEFITTSGFYMLIEFGKVKIKKLRLK